MRQTVYVPSYGYITSDRDFDYMGNGIFGDIANLAKDLVTSKAAKDLVVDAGKSFASTVGKKGGEKVAEKLVSKVFSDKKKDIEVIKPVKEKPKNTIKQNKDLLAEIYGNGLFRQSGKGLRRV